MEKKIAFVVGTRPEWIKIKPILKHLDANLYDIILTGQHDSEFISIDYPVTELWTIPDKCTNRLNNIFSSITKHDLSKYKVICVVGDTTSAAATALCAKNSGRILCHIEAGLRTYDNENPYPEEINRRIISLVADIHFCPTIGNLNNLISERIQGDKYITGNTSIDNLIGIEAQDGTEVLCTLHRRENLPIIDKWISEIKNLSVIYTDLLFTIVRHPNHEIEITETDSLKVINPMPHDIFTHKLAQSKYIITDSGGLQEEASFFRKPYIVCRKTTERPEGIDKGFGLLCKTPNELKSNFSYAENLSYDEVCPFGDGNSGQRISKILLETIYNI